MNPYLERLQAQYDQLIASVEQILSTAAGENRDLSESELTSVRAMQSQADELQPRITELVERETRISQVAQARAALASARPSDEPVETRTPAGPGDGDGSGERQERQPLAGGAQTRDRDPGHYLRGGRNSFFCDVHAMKTRSDSDARQRLTEHARALTMSDEGPGVVLPVWMVNEFETIARQQRRVANAVRSIPITNAAPITMPKQTSGVDNIIANQSAEGTNNAGWFTDAWDSDTDTVTPVATAGGQDVARQLLESGNPAVDALIFGDCLEVYNLKVEAKVVAAAMAAAGVAVATYATEAAWTIGLDPAAATYVVDAITDASLAVRVARKLPADILICSVARYGSLLKIKDTSGRPIIPSSNGGAMNVPGRGDVPTDGYLDTAGLAVLSTDGVTQYPESLVAARSQDILLFESPVLRFQYEEVLGPSAVRIGIWAYTATHVKHAGKSTKRIQITAAS